MNETIYVSCLASDFPGQFLLVEICDVQVLTNYHPRPFWLRALNYRTNDYEFTTMLAIRQSQWLEYLS